ncbi:MAG: aspartate aminotransferase family protein [Halorientalis sp.]
MAVGPPIDDLHFSDAPSVDAVPGPESRRLRRRQERVESNAVMYPHDLPVALGEAKGATVRDVDGNTYLDFFAGIGVVNVGHSNPYVVEGVREQTETLVHTLDFPSETRIELIERLDDVVPGDLAGHNCVAFGGPTGSDAIEATIKLAKAATGGDGLIAFRGGYHGGTAGALSLTSDVSEKEAYAPLLADVQHVRYPYPLRQDLPPERAVEESLREVWAVFEDEWSGLSNPAGIWVEPIQGEGGVVVPPAGFLEGLRDIADEHGVPLVVDEVQTGFGRTGEWFGCEHAGVTPDVMPIAKAAGGIGLPLSATVFDADLDVFEPAGHSGTFRGYLPGMRACIRAIDYIEARDLRAHAADLGEYMCGRLEAVADGVPGLVEVRGRGLFVGAEFHDEAGDPDGEVVAEIRRECMRRGVLAWAGGRDGSVLRLLPPLVMTRAQAETGLDVVAAAIREVAGGGPGD